MDSYAPLLVLVVVVSLPALAVAASDTQLEGGGDSVVAVEDDGTRYSSAETESPTVTETPRGTNTPAATSTETDREGDPDGPGQSGGADENGSGSPGGPGGDSQTTTARPATGTEPERGGRATGTDPAGRTPTSPGPSETVTPTSEITRAEPDDGSVTSLLGPGFGILAAVVALLAVAHLAARRE